MKLAIFTLALLLASCAKNSLSDRDAKKEQLKSAAETKRQELALVAGDYQGLFIHTTGQKQNTTLKLEIKDIPVQVEGGVDPILTPTLKGFLRFNLGANGEGSEYIGFSVEKGDFDPKQNKLDLVVTNSEYKDIIITCFAMDSALEGSWTAPTSATNGTLKLSRGVIQSQTLAEQMAGEYGGILFQDPKNLYQFSSLTLSTSIKPPEGLKVAATLRVIFGAWNSTEYLTYRFDPVQFNPMTGQIILKSETADLVFSGQWSQGELQGEWSSVYTGKLGKVSFKKNTVPSNQIGTLFHALKGTYQGKIVNTNHSSNLPERLMVSFVTSQDLSKPNGISVTGSMRLYLGEFGSNEYVEYPFSDVQFNFFTRTLIARVSGEYKLTLKGSAEAQIIKGTVSADALGEVGTFEVIKQ